MIRLKRVYEKWLPEDGARILVERLWPRGVKKEQAALDSWLKDVAPSPELRRWFGHDPGKWKQFEHRYWQELHGARQQQSINLLRRKAREGTVTLVYAARDRQHIAAVALKQFVEDVENDE